MTPADKEKLLKVLKLTSSDKDGEALAAARAASRILQRVELDWETLLSPPQRYDPFAPRRPAEARPNEDVLLSMLNYLRARRTPENYLDSWIVRLHAQYIRHRTLTERQQEALVNIFVRYGGDLELYG